MPFRLHRIPGPQNRDLDRLPPLSTTVRLSSRRSLERDKPSDPFWLGYQPPPHQEPEHQRLEELWQWFVWRWSVEPSIRLRKQYLHWTLVRFQEPERCDRWTMLVDIAQWQLFLARDLVRDCPLPWQPAQEQLRPERTLQSLGATFREIGTPAAPPQTRGKSPGWR